MVAQNVVLIQCMAQCWGNYSFALGLTFRRTLLGFYLHMVDGQPSGGCSGLGKRAGSGGQGAGAEAVPKMKLRLALKVSIESPASGFLEGLFLFRFDGVDYIECEIDHWVPLAVPSSVTLTALQLCCQEHPLVPSCGPLMETPRPLRSHFPFFPPSGPWRPSVSVRLPIVALHIDGVI